MKRQCLGGANAKQCEERGGQKVNFEQFWHDFKMKSPKVKRMSLSDDFKTDTLEFLRVPVIAILSGSKIF